MSPKICFRSEICASRYLTIYMIDCQLVFLSKTKICSDILAPDFFPWTKELSSSNSRTKYVFPS